MTEDLQVEHARVKWIALTKPPAVWYTAPTPPGALVMAPPVSDWPVDDLTVDERLALLGRVWDSLLDAGPPPVPDWHRPILRERITAADANPEASIPADELFRELLGEES